MVEVEFYSGSLLIYYSTGLIKMDNLLWVRLVGVIKSYNLVGKWEAR